MTVHRSPITARGFFVTGTDTGVGKTLVACALLHAFAARGLRVVGMKPVAAGAELRDGKLVHEDVSALQAASNLTAPDDLVNPYCFLPPIAPHIAAAEAGIAIDLKRLKNAFLELTTRADCVIVEGVGGFRVPLGPRLETSDLAMQLQLPVVLVVGLRLGCLNHALLTAAALRTAGLKIAGWVANYVDPAMARSNENVAALSERLEAPLLARIPHLNTCDPARIARELRLEVLQTASAFSRKP